MATIETNQRTVITELDIEDLKLLQAKMTEHVLIIKFGAEWCGPCKKIAPVYQEFIKKSPSNIIFADIDVDDNLDLYLGLKKHKMIQGIPVFLAFWGGINRLSWYIPDDSVIGADEITVAKFFDRCVKKATDLAVKQVGYSYFN